VYRDPINPDFRWRTLFQSTAGVWDFGSDLFYIGRTPFVSTSLFWLAIGSMVAPSIIFVVMNLRPVKAHIVQVMSHLVLTLIPCAFDKLVTVQCKIIERIQIVLHSRSQIFTKTQEAIQVARTKLHYSPKGDGQIVNFDEALQKLLSLLLQLVTILVIYSLCAIYAAIVTCLCSVIWFVVVAVISNVVFIMLIAMVPCVTVSVFVLTVVGLLFFINFKMGACATLSKWFQINEDPDGTQTTYVFNSGIILEVFLEAIPQIVIINVNTWQLGKGGSFAYWFSLTWGVLSIVNVTFPFFAHCYYERSVVRAFELPLYHHTARSESTGND
jgi:hypothetical protein